MRASGLLGQPPRTTMKRVDRNAFLFCFAITIGVTARQHPVVRHLKTPYKLLGLGKDCTNVLNTMASCDGVLGRIAKL